MAIARDRPYPATNFLVDFGNGKARAVSGGFSEVIFPDFEVHAPAVRATTDAATAPAAEAPASSRHLILKRGFVGALDLYAWWHKARQGKAPKRRTVRVCLLGDDHESVVAVWRFREARPVRLSYSPLRANEPTVLIESIELAFERMEME